MGKPPFFEFTETCLSKSLGYCVREGKKREERKADSRAETAGGRPFAARELLLVPAGAVGAARAAGAVALPSSTAAVEIERSGEKAHGAKGTYENG